MNVVPLTRRYGPFVLILIDFQKPWDRRPNEAAPTMALNLLAHVRRSNWPVIHVFQGGREADFPLGQVPPAPDIMEGFQPTKGEHVFHRSCLSAFGATGFADALKRVPHYAFIATPRFAEAGIATLYEGIERGFNLKSYALGCSSAKIGRFGAHIWQDLPLIVEQALNNTIKTGAFHG